MFTIDANSKKTRTLSVSEQHLQTLEQYGLLNRLVPSSGIVDEMTVEKLKMNVRSLISAENDDVKDLLDLCIELIYHPNMKAYGLQELITLYDDWKRQKDEERFLKDDAHEE